MENLSLLSELKNKVSDPMRLKQFTNDIETFAIQPLSSFELKLYSRYYYRIKTRDMPDSSSFLQLEMISRTFKELIMKDLIVRQSKDGGLMYQGIVKETFKKRIHSIIAEK